MKPQGAVCRIALLDALRGLAVIQMVLYHGIYDWVYVFGREARWFTDSQNAYLWEQVICWSFILIAGAVFPYGKKPVRRGLQVFGCALVLTGVTLAVLPSERILFGVLHFLGASMLLSAAAKPVLARIPAAAGALACFALFLLFKQFPAGYLGVGDWRIWQLPEAWYQMRWTFPLGLMGPDFYSADYFPLLPWLFLFWTGLYLWKLAAASPCMEQICRVPRVPVLDWVGRHSLLCYMLHQPVLLALVWLTGQIVR